MREREREKNTLSLVDEIIDEIEEKDKTDVREYALRIAQRRKKNTFWLYSFVSLFFDSIAIFTCWFVWKINGEDWEEHERRIYLDEDCHCLDAYHQHLVRLDSLISMHRDSLLLELYQYSSYIEYVYCQTNYWPTTKRMWYGMSEWIRRKISILLARH